MVNDYESINALQVESESDNFTIDRYKQFCRYIPIHSISILDIGCNTGRGGEVVKHLLPNTLITGLDTVKDRVARLPKEYYSGIYGISTNIPCADSLFDVVVAGEFIEHLYPIDVDKTFKEVFRILKNKGRFLLTTPNPDDIKRKLRKESVLGGAHLSQHFSKDLKVRLKCVGFSNIRILGSGKVTRFFGGKISSANLWKLFGSGG